MKAYITAPYTGKSIIKGNKSYGKIDDQSFKNFLDVIESALSEFGISTFLPHRDIHEWGKVDIAAGEVMKRVFKAIKECDLFVSYPEYSKGPNVELGMAITLGKRSIIIQNENERVSVVYAGLSDLTPTKIIKFKDVMDMKEKLRSELSDFIGKK